MINYDKDNCSPLPPKKKQIKAKFGAWQQFFPTITKNPSLGNPRVNAALLLGVQCSGPKPDGNGHL